MTPEIPMPTAPDPKPAAPAPKPNVASAVLFPARADCGITLEQEFSIERMRKISNRKTRSDIIREALEFYSLHNDPVFAQAQQTKWQQAMGGKTHG